MSTEIPKEASTNSTGDKKARGPRRPKGPASREEKVSRALSKLLRHQAVSAGIKLDTEGFASLDKVLSWGSLKSDKVTFDEVQSCTRDNAKQRFTMKLKPDSPEDSTDPIHWLIRANQGHSIPVDSTALLTPVESPYPTTVIHGTFFTYWAAIMKSGGISRMGRNHVHCAEGVPGETDKVMSGMRGDAELIVEIDIERSINEGGLKWWRSENGVLLTEGDTEGLISTRFFKKVTGRRVDVGTLVEDGVEVGVLPEGLKMVVPQGKHRQKGQR